MSPPPVGECPVLAAAQAAEAPSQWTLSSLCLPPGGPLVQPSTGAGTMGSGIAQTLVMKGLKVILFDTKHSFVDRGISMVNKNLEKLVKKGTITPEVAHAAASRIEPAVSLD
eukprot:gene23125-30326_t